MKGRWSHPRAWSKARNMTSTGIVMQRRVIITRRDDGDRGFSKGELVLSSAAACNAVDNRETKMDPTLPGNPGDNSWTVSLVSVKNQNKDLPLITTARRAKPSYRLTNKSSTIPVPLLMIMAPNKGVHPWVKRALTWEFRRVAITQEMAERTINTPTINGIGVWINEINKVDTNPRRTKRPS